MASDGLRLHSGSFLHSGTASDDRGRLRVSYSPNSLQGGYIGEYE